MRPQDIIDAARGVLNDRDAGAYRTQDADLLQYVNDFTKAVARGKPGLVTALLDVVLVAGEYQEVSRATTSGLIRVLRNSAGRHVKPIQEQSLLLQFPGRNDAAPGPVTEWAPMEGDPFRFVVFPEAAAGDTALCLVDAVPPDIDMGVEMPISDAYRAAGVNYVAGRVLLKNTNAADAERAAGLMSAASALAGIKVGA